MVEPPLRRRLTRKNNRRIGISFEAVDESSRPWLLWRFVDSSPVRIWTSVASIASVRTLLLVRTVFRIAYYSVRHFDKVLLK